MNKLICYFRGGKGRGLKAMLIFSLVISLIAWGLTANLFNALANNSGLIQFINQLPEITIENGEIVSPQNTNRIYTYQGRPVKLYLQTERDYPAMLSADGFYLTRKAFSIVSEGQVQQISPLMESGVINPENIQKVIRALALWIPIMLAVLYFFILWIFYLIVVGICALITLICRFKLNKGAVWRSSTFSVITIMLICVAVGLFGRTLPTIANIPLLSQLILSILLTLLIVFGIREKGEVAEKTKKGKQK